VINLDLAIYLRENLRSISNELLNAFCFSSSAFPIAEKKTESYVNCVGLFRLCGGNFIDTRATS
jgi:hypothetical protein